MPDGGPIGYRSLASQARSPGGVQLSAETDAKAARAQPLVWALTGHRFGDNLQVRTLADALGWPCEEKALTWRRRLGWTPAYGRMAPSLVPLTEASRAAIAPPWPDLVISVGWRSAPVARWIAGESGARLVHIGRPRAPLAAFDLVLTTPQYRLPEAPNVIRLDAPMTRLAGPALARAAEVWRPRLAHLPRPWIAVLIGGDAPPLRLTETAAQRLGAQAAALVRVGGGSLLIATGPRTGTTAAQAVLSQIDDPYHAYLWSDNGENPYQGYLALADAFVVTADSISMAHEASLTGKPVHLFELPSSGAWGLRVLQCVDGWLSRSAIYQSLIREGWIYAPRAPEAYHEALIARGSAARLGDTMPTGGTAEAADSTAEAVAAVRALLGYGGIRTR